MPPEPGHSSSPFSEALMAEIRGVLREKFHWSDEMLDEANAGLANFVQIVKSTETLRVIEEDPDDDRILECAIASGSQFIVSGDKHLLNRCNTEVSGL
jgi:uncharacterized protein